MIFLKNNFNISYFKNWNTFTIVISYRIDGQSSRGNVLNYFSSNRMRVENVFFFSIPTLCSVYEPIIVTNTRFVTLFIHFWLEWRDEYAPTRVRYSRYSILTRWVLFGVRQGGSRLYAFILTTQKVYIISTVSYLFPIKYFEILKHQLFGKNVHFYYTKLIFQVVLQIC